MTVEFRDPPARNTRLSHDRNLNTFTSEVVDALRSHPGRWARVERGVAKSRADTWRQASYRKRCEVTHRETPEGTVDVYARWRG